MGRRRRDERRERKGTQSGKNVKNERQNNFAISSLLLFFAHRQSVVDEDGGAG
jgi:hypothetical protein